MWREWRNPYTLLVGTETGAATVEKLRGSSKKVNQSYKQVQRSHHKLHT